ncbi:hypothetical protein [Nocardia terrae]|uniref:hypothetical protein n=1 Tax=Nocardia terrae TaxID=2675851 RepID=UPI001F1AE850|nr:hypothetical protein [Nocardia terrae]
MAAEDTTTPQPYSSSRLDGSVATGTYRVTSMELISGVLKLQFEGAFEGEAEATVMSTLISGTLVFRTLSFPGGEYPAADIEALRQSINETVSKMTLQEFLDASFTN